MTPPDTYSAGNAMADRRARGPARTVVNVPWSHSRARDGAPRLKTRPLATVVGQSAQTAPRLKSTVRSARASGSSRADTAEVVFHMALHGGYPAMVNALSTAADNVFVAEDAA
jgi:alkylhydroperoxidase/carboxymuconolactone decarboxylase family protein YurZ